MGVLLAKCKIGWMYASSRQLRTERLKNVQLLFGLRACVIGGRREVRHQTLQPRVLGRANRLQNVRGRSTRSQPSHPAIDFQMIFGRNPASRRHPIPCRNIGERMNHRRQVVVQKAGSLGGQKIRHH